MKKFKLYLYLFSYFIRLALCQPTRLLEEMRVLKNQKKKFSSLDFKNYLLGKYLPEKYLLKTKLHIQEPSPSIFKKVLLFLPVDFYKTPRSLDTLGISTPCKILVIRSGAMGDVLLTTPIIRELYLRRKGHCQIDIATRYADLFIHNPYVHKVLDPQELRSLEHGYDLIINLDMVLERNKAAHVTHAYYFHTFGYTGIEDTNLQPEIYSSEQDRQVADEIAKQFPDGFIVCHNRHDSTQPYRNVPIAQWEKILTELSQQTNLAILNVGSLDMDIYIDHPNCHDYRGRLSLQELKALIARAKLFLGTDAGPLHIAATCSTPIVCFFTLAHHETRKPLRHGNDLFIPIAPNIECYGCVKDYPLAWGFECKRKDFACTQSFSTIDAIQSCLQLLKISR